MCVHTDVVDGLEDVVVEVVDLGGLLVGLPRGQLAHPRDLREFLLIRCRAFWETESCFYVYHESATLGEKSQNLTAIQKTTSWSCLVLWQSEGQDRVVAT